MKKYKNRVVKCFTRKQLKKTRWKRCLSRWKKNPDYICLGGFVEFTDELDPLPLWEGMYPDDPSELPLPPLPKGVDE